MAKYTILVVDDEPQNLHVLIRILKSDYRIKVAKRGPKALAIASKETPSVILLDVNMPEMDGFTVCERLKADSITQSIPVIFISATMTDADRQKALDLGAVDFLVKPVEPNILKQKIKELLDN